jgi:hypothetical protein
VLTWERFMGGTHGFANMPKKTSSFFQGISGRGMELTLPEMKNFYFTGAWAVSAGVLFMNALSGRKVMQAICWNERKSFIAPRRL